jgi:hypothetical protein
MKNRQINQWMLNTLHFAAVCGGRDDNTADELHRHVRAVAGRLAERAGVAAVVPAFLAEAASVVAAGRGPCDVDDTSAHEPGAVVCWLMTTFELVRRAAGEPDMSK